MFSCFLFIIYLKHLKGWLTGICVLETGDEMNIWEIVIQEKFDLCNPNYHWHLKCPYWKSWIYFDQIINERVIVAPKIAWTGSVKPFKLHWNDFQKMQKHASQYDKRLVWSLFAISVFPDAPYRCRWEITCIWLCPRLGMKFRIVNNKLCI